MAAIILLMAAWSQLLNSLEWRWRAMMIGFARSVRVIPVSTMEFPEEELPLVVLFQKTFEDPAAGVIGSEGTGPGDDSGHDSTDARVMADRAARLLLFYAAAPEELRPAAVGFDLVFPEGRNSSYPTLAAALRELGNVTMAVTTEASASNDDRLLGSTADLTSAASGVGYDGFPLPAWTPPGQAARLYAPGPGWLPGGEPKPLWLVLLEAAEGPQILPDDVRLVPLFYPNLYFPGPDSDAVLSRRLGGYWPTQSALNCVRLVPERRPDETPQAWVLRAREALKDSAAAKLLWEEAAGRIVVVGLGLPADSHPTPFTRARYRSRFRQAGEPPLTPGPVVHALAISTWQHRRVPVDLWRNSSATAGALGLPGGLLLCLAGYRVRRRRGLALLVLFAAVVAAADVVGTAWGNVWLPTFHVLLFGFVGFFLGQVESRVLFLRAGEEARQLLRRLLPASSLALVEDGGAVDVAFGAEHRSETAWRTAMILDLAGYTQFTFALYRQQQRQLALELIADFFRTVIAALGRHGGEVSDLTGDGVAVAFSGSEKEQARNALAAAVAAVQATRAWRETAEARCAAAGVRAPIPGLRIGVGAAETTLGFFGTDKQVRAVFFGGAFAIAARVEQGLKSLPIRGDGQRFWRVALTEAVLGHYEGPLPDGLVLHRHEPLIAKGITEPIAISEILPPVGLPSD